MPSFPQTTNQLCILGVIRNQSCVYHERWQAYECLDLNYEMLVIESMDEDTEIRRISPVAIEGHDRQGNGYVDLINGPQDHGWCFGYTCRKRLSTFQALVITGKELIFNTVKPGFTHLPRETPIPDLIRQVVFIYRLLIYRKHFIRKFKS